MPKVAKTCAICGGHFEVWGDRAETAVTCSRVCSGKWQARGYAEARATLSCEICKKDFSVPQSHKDRRTCCSVKCSAKLDSQRNHATGADSPNWKGGIVNHAGGYLYMSVATHPFTSTGNYVFEHRLVMEEWMREEAPDHKFLVEVGGTKYLSPDIDVHHIDENRRHNVRKNLLACTHGAHQMIHRGENPMAGEVWPPLENMAPHSPTVVTCTCAVCGKQFRKKRSDVKRGSGKYCSRACYIQRVATE